MPGRSGTAAKRATSAATEDSVRLENIKISGVQEHDVHLLLLEEFHSSPSFQKWFVEEVRRTVATPGVTLPQRLRFTEAEHSVAEAIGETDVEAQYSTDENRKVFFLIEVKINAPFQKDQASRYRQRATVMSRENGARALTVLVAPKAYLTGRRDNRGFDAVITYERLLEFFAEDEVVGNRRNYKRALLAIAAKGKPGSEGLPNEAVTSFWKQYCELAHILAPTLEMARREGVPQRSGFIYFRPDTLPTNMRLVHKMTTPHHCVDLQFLGFGRRCAELRRVFRDRLDPSMEIDFRGKSGVIRVQVPALNPKLSFAEQEPAAREGILAAKHLWEWFLRNRSVWAATQPEGA